MQLSRKERPRAHIACIMSLNPTGTTNISHSSGWFVSKAMNDGSEKLLSPSSSFYFCFKYPMCVHEFHFKRRLFYFKFILRISSMVTLIPFIEWSARPIFLRLNHLFCLRIVIGCVHWMGFKHHHLAKFRFFICEQKKKSNWIFSAFFLCFHVIISKIAVILFMVCNARFKSGYDSTHLIVCRRVVIQIQLNMYIEMKYTRLKKKRGKKTLFVCELTTNMLRKKMR